MEEDKAYGYWMHNLPGIGDRTIEKLLKIYGSAREVYAAWENDKGNSPEKVLGKDKAEKIKEFSKNWDVEKKYEQLTKTGIAFYSLEDKAYPKKLRELTHPPYGLYCMGNLPGEGVPAAAVIGARECSEYGRYMAKAFAGKLAGAGVSIVSGMARGIDGIGQKAALESGGKTYAVLGSGVDVIYPLCNQKLYHEILEKGGGILSVFPPGTKPAKNYFPERNRIVAGLCDVLLVVEARIKSGTWITVDMALEQGKNVYAVPGRLTDRLSDGCNLLIRQGAGIALSPSDIMAELAVLLGRKGEMGQEKNPKPSYYKGAGKKRRNFRSDVSADDGAGGEKMAGEDRKETEGADAALLSCLDYYPASADEILERMRKNGKQMEMAVLLPRLMELCMEGKAKQTGSTYFAKTQQAVPVN